MRYVRYALLAIILIVVVLLAVANREMVTLRLMPEQLAGIYQLSYGLPLFAVILATLLLGVFLGYVLEWGREMRQRREASERKRIIAKLERENAELRRRHAAPKDEVLAILE
ncbi:lipopolysaccharide assembly LapA domain-containing protein [Oceanicella sp. SM1341]|uniref:LapA family protein n=1 Tax=Oceanicella sp. SM1341 TaxID=1548889 RepID=UPI000E51AAE1|nr:LapA family protein [Oceanicella sp. SM1341]